VAKRTRSLHQARAEKGTGKNTGWLPIRETREKSIEPTAVGDLTEDSKRLLARALAEPDDDDPMIAVRAIADPIERRRARGRLYYRESKAIAKDRRMVIRGWI
jgi:hypothetical protein